MELLKTNGRCDCTNRLGRRYEDLFLSEKYCDCIFVVAAEEQFKCHKLILAAASPVFEAMFYGALREQQNVIDIPDMSAEIFKQLLIYIYKGYVDFEVLSLQQTIELYYGGEKYLLDDLNDLCLTAIQQKLRYSNILAVLELSIHLDFQRLLTICLNFLLSYCLREEQFVMYLKTNYYHVSIDCMKAIIKYWKEAAENQSSQWINGSNAFMQFFYIWYQQECSGDTDTTSTCTDRTPNRIRENDLKELVSDIETIDGCSMTLVEKYKQGSFHYANVRSVERWYLKAWRVLKIDEINFECRTCIKCDRFISLMGLILPNRLAPCYPTNCDEYIEHITVEISSTMANDKVFEWIYQQKHRYDVSNSNLNIKWPQDMLILPNIQYEIKLKWPTNNCSSMGAEYPHDILSNNVDGIEFIDGNLFDGSLIKGLFLSERI